VEQRPSAPDPVGETADTIASIRARADEDFDRHQRWIEVLISGVGRPRTLYLIALVVAAWVLYNTVGVRLGAPLIDAAPFFWLQGVLTLYAATIATSVLVRQNREAKHDAQRDHLELQVNMLAEQKTAKIIALLEELREDMPNVRNRVDREAEAMTHAIDAREVLDAFDEQQAVDGDRADINLRDYSK
jgi:uncharacterized membrane protein